MKNLNPAMTKQDILRFAEGEAHRQGLRWTTTRTQVLEALLHADQCLTAYQLLEAVATRNDRAVKPASVYRSLDALITLGIVAKVESRNAFIVCQHLPAAHQHIFLVCNHCGQIDEIPDCSISMKLMKDAAAKGFKASRQVMELYGDCQTCRT